MSTSDKLTYLNGTKQALKESINNLGGDITNETTFREYAEELDNIYDNLPKTTGEDTNLSLNTLKGKMNITPKGDTSQYTTNGYQLINLKDGTYTRYGLTAVVSNGKITINGSTDVLAIIDVHLNNSVTLTNGQSYTLYGFNTTANSNVAFRPIGDYGDFQVDFSSVNNKQAKTFSSTTTTITSIGIRVGGGTSVSNLVCNPMLISGSDTSKSYEPYTNGASPNPTYPQNIEVVTGTQNVKASGNEFAEIETQTLNGMTITKTDNGYILNGTASANTTFRATITNPTNSNKTLCVKCDTAITNANVQVKTRNSSAGQLRSISLSTANVWEVLSGTFEDYYCDIYVKSGTTLSNVLVQPMLLEGTFTTSNLGKYQPYNGEQTQAVNLGDIELCKIGNYQDYLYKTSGKNLYKPRLTIDGNNIYKNACNLTLDGDEFTFVATGTDMYLGQVINIGSAYVSSGAGNLIEVGDMTNLWYKFTNTNMNRVHITAYDSNKISLGYTGITGTTGTYIIPSNAKYISVRIGKTDAVSGTIYKTKFILASGTTIGEYEPYGSGKWYKKENIYNYKFLDNDNWVETDNHLQGCYTIYKSTPKKTMSNTYTPYCTNLIGVNNPNYGSQTTANSIGVSGDRFNVYIPSATTTTMCMSIMAEQKVYYVLATPNDIEITNTTLIEQLNNLQKLKSYNGVTNISSSGNLSAILSVSALKGE